jgi:hypothetical protein
VVIVCVFDFRLSHSNRDQQRETFKFILEAAANDTASPTVLFSHLPLYRERSLNCGRYTKLRSSPKISQM